MSFSIFNCFSSNSMCFPVKAVKNKIWVKNKAPLKRRLNAYLLCCLLKISYAVYRRQLWIYICRFCVQFRYFYFYVEYIANLFVTIIDICLDNGLFIAVNANVYFNQMQDAKFISSNYQINDFQYFHLYMKYEF